VSYRFSDEESRYVERTGRRELALQALSPILLKVHGKPAIWVLDEQPT
jgi:hypothetical protein